MSKPWEIEGSLEDMFKVYTDNNSEEVVIHELTSYGVSDEVRLSKAEAIQYACMLLGAATGNSTNQMLSMLIKELL